LLSGSATSKSLKTETTVLEDEDFKGYKKLSKKGEKVWSSLRLQKKADNLQKEKKERLGLNANKFYVNSEARIV